MNNTMSTLFVLFRQNKTKMATLKNPVMFLRHLRDHKVITDEQFNTGSQCSEESMYRTLEFVEGRGIPHVEKFWNVVNQEHILKLYPQLSELTKNIKSLPFKERHDKRRSENISESDKVGPSSQCTEKLTKRVRRAGSHSAPGGLPHVSGSANVKKSGARHSSNGDFKKERAEMHCDSNQAGSSSQKTAINKKTAEPERAGSHSAPGGLPHVSGSANVKKSGARDSSNDVFKKERAEMHSDSNQAGTSSQKTASNKKTAELKRAGSHSAPGGLPHVSGSANVKKSGARDSRNQGFKKERAEIHSDSNEAGPSSLKTASNKKTAEPERGVQMNLWDMPQHNEMLPVTCGTEKAFLIRTALYHRKRECIRMKGKMITPFEFEKMGGKGAHKAWKNSIECQGYSLSTLMKMGILKIPDCSGKKFTLHK